ncbi:hypothetical protein Lepto7376_0299 [[Leptolyngbya] sp. PCC 7376]|uniref:SH3 domain-containing protein n=1 Tax=[Leptolyngbya] sp. PCC 7376 TaxID=111781 RepID=UPI00029EE8E6|nr:SH3 domain-containing protein [[Leptolyngbya] sp. PCC 7376]AFY36741.1 hypothetical protein Lepto7376_0299 [[Leptolyngbya] sp. PCC 7376]
MKAGLVAAGCWLAIGMIATEAQALPWQSNRTTIEALDNLCRGDRQLEQVRTEFGGRVYNGTIQLNRVFKTTGCEAGDQVKGEFSVAGTGQTHCEGNISIAFVDEYTAKLEWDIINAKHQTDCPVRHTFWQTEVRRSDAPEANSGLSFTVATVSEAPARIRTAPNGALMCSVEPGQRVSILSQPFDGWYRTEACGTVGYVNDDYLIFFE